MNEEVMNIINTAFHIDGKDIRAKDIVDTIPKETLIAALATLIAKFEK